MFSCEACGALFDEPSIYPMRENLDGENGWETRIEAACPWCGEEWVKEVCEDPFGGEQT